MSIEELTTPPVEIFGNTHSITITGNAYELGKVVAFIGLETDVQAYDVPGEVSNRAVKYVRFITLDSETEV